MTAQHAPTQKTPPAAAKSAHHGLRSPEERAKSHVEPARPAPHSPALPLIGQLLQVRKLGMLGFLDAQWHKHGDVFRVSLGNRQAVVVAHPDAMERVLGSHRDRYVKGRAYDGARQILGNGLLTATGLAWRNQRALMQPSFHREGLRRLVQSITSSVERYFADLERRLPRGGQIDVHREMVKLTLDVVIEALFGSGLVEAADVSYETLIAVLEIVSERSNGVPIPLWLPTPGNIRFKRVLGELDALIYRLIDKARAQRRGRAAQPAETLLDMLLDAVDEATGKPLPDKHVRDELLTLFVAGHETTALTMTWLFVLLEGRDDVWGRLREEATSVLHGRTPTFEDLSRLPYTRAVIDEVLRLRGPVALVARDVVEDDNLLGFEIHKGDMVLPYFYGVHRHPGFWERPNEFWPERFLPEHSAGRDRWAYLPFSSGQRVCIGNMFSIHESVLILAVVAQRADTRLVPGQTLNPEMIATVRPSAPAQVDWRWRVHQTPASRAGDTQPVGA